MGIAVPQTFGRFCAHLKQLSWRKRCAEAVMDPSRRSYHYGLDIATKEMKSSNPTRLELAPNFAVFHFEVLKHFRC
ncbi:hypothetical protein niasHS_013244 [Heterodera schachtii]|uniref:14-3-3 domain-containing protein n=1 Tax=Heterodera schachtii TaxID=97005 RepID=A0ABD2IHC7_HETSC